MPLQVTDCRILRSHNGQFDARNRGTYAAVWRVKAEVVGEPDTGQHFGARGIANSALTAGPHPLPAHGEAYDLTDVMQDEADDYSFAQNYDVQFLEENRRLADITVTYTPLGPGETPASRRETDVTQRKAQFWWSRESYARLVDQVQVEDPNNPGQTIWVPFTTATGEVWDRPPQREATRGVLVMEFPLPSLSAVASFDRRFSNSVNATEWTFTDPDTGQQFTAGPREALCRYVRSQKRVFEPPLTAGGAPQRYYSVELGIVFAGEGEDWDLEVLHEGYMHYEEDAGGNPQLDGQGAPKPAVRAKLLNPDTLEPTDDITPVPVLLRENGTRLPQNTVGAPRKGRAYPEIDFAELNQFIG